MMHAEGRHPSVLSFASPTFARVGNSVRRWKAPVKYEHDLRRPGRRRELADLLPLVPGVLFHQRADFSFEFISPAAELLTGVSAAVWRKSRCKFWSVVHETDREEVRRRCQEVAETGKTVSFTYRIRNARSGRVHCILERRQPAPGASRGHGGYVGNWLDVTRQTVAEQRLKRMAWTETLRRVTAGLVHDFANILAGVQGLADRLHTGLDAQHPARESLSLISSSCSEATQMARNIMSLHRGETGLRQYHDLNNLTSELIAMLGRVMPRQIKVLKTLTESALPAHLDAAEFRQAVTNLMLNAVDAMPEGGTLTLATSRQNYFPAAASPQGTAPQSPAVCLTVSDTGCGIKPHLLPFIFEPFFTTKVFGKGNGLGLYNARMFAERHGGALTVDSTSGSGSRFHLWFPEANLNAAEDVGVNSDRQLRRLLLLGNGNVFTRESVNFLQLHGYQVSIAPTVEAATEYLFSGIVSFDGMIVSADSKDNPAMTFAARIRREKRPMKIILHPIGMNLDEVPDRMLRQFHMVISTDLPVVEILEQLRALFRAPPKGKRCRD